MNYDLLKELKDAGFPQGSKGKYRMEMGVPMKTEPVYIPDLEELKEACGDKLLSLEQIEDGSYTDGRLMWWAMGVNHQRGGVTAEEAMAHLWLALKKDGLV